MAERRMFAKTIIDSDAFLDMPLSSQALYFHLSMRADDEGFINNPRKVQRMVGASDDDLKLLIAKNFIIPFESGIVVIKHWKIHNYIQSDRFKATVYTEEKSHLIEKENKAYTLDTECIHNGYTLETQVSIGKDSIDKVSIDKSNTDKPKTQDKPAKHAHGEYKKVYLTNEEFCKLKAEFGSERADEAIRFLDEYIEEKSYKSKSHYLAIRRWVINAVDEQTSRKDKQGNTKTVGNESAYQRDREWAEEMQAMQEKGELNGF